MLPFAPASAYGTPEQLKHLIDSAHGMGLMVFVDVIYNHFGPDGNYLAQYARRVLSRRPADALGPGHRFPSRRSPRVLL